GGGYRRRATGLRSRATCRRQRARGWVRRIRHVPCVIPADRLGLTSFAGERHTTTARHHRTHFTHHILLHAPGFVVDPRRVALERDPRPRIRRCEILTD